MSDTNLLVCNKPTGYEQFVIAVENNETVVDAVVVDDTVLVETVVSKLKIVLIVAVHLLRSLK